VNGNGVSMCLVDISAGIWFDVVWIWVRAVVLVDGIIYNWSSECSMSGLKDF